MCACLCKRGADDDIASPIEKVPLVEMASDEAIVEVPPKVLYQDPADNPMEDSVRSQQPAPPAPLPPIGEVPLVDTQQQVMLSPFKLKAMAMRLRHRHGKLKFVKQRLPSHGSSGVAHDLEEPLLEDGNGARKRWASAGKSTATTPAQSPATCQSHASLKTGDSTLVVQGSDNWLGLKAILLHPFSVLLVCIPVGIASGHLGWGATWTFWINFLALLPLAKILGDATEELAGSLNSDSISGLLNATFGNAVEMIVSIMCIKADKFGVVKASLLGSVLSNILLVLGSSFMVGGFSLSRRLRGIGHAFHGVEQDHITRSRILAFEKEQKFPLRGVLVSMALLLSSCMACSLPTLFSAFSHDKADHVKLQVSRIGACILISTYFAFLFYQLITHRQTLDLEEKGEIGGRRSAIAPSPPNEFTSEEEDDDEGEGSSLSVSFAVSLMAICAIIVAVNSDYLVGAIDDVVRKQGLPEAFIGIILLPIAGNACEHAGALRFAADDKPALAIGIAVGSSTQIALFVVPFSVVVAWIWNKPLDLDFGVLNIVVVTMSVLVVLVMLIDGRSNWLKGYILVALYVFIGVLYVYAPDDNAVPS